MTGSRVDGAIADLVLCVAFFTRVPMPHAGAGRNFADALWAAPVVGALVGLIAGTVALTGLWVGLPAGAAAVLAVAAGIAITGGLHEDGAADVADGFGGGKSRADKLAIMRDSRIGSYGTLALILSLLARWSAIGALAAAGGAGVVLALVAAHAASRAVLPAFAAQVQPARADGLSAGIGAIEPRTVWLALAIGFAALLLLGIGFALVMSALLAAIALGLAALCRRQIGGQTGDVLGALQQAAEIAVLLAAAAIFI